VAQIFEGGWDVGGEAWKWRRRSWAWEEKLVEECRNLLLTLMLQVDTDDVWRWTPNAVNGYTARGAYRLLTATMSINDHV